MEPDEVRTAITDGTVSQETQHLARERIAALERYVPRGFLFAEVQFAQRPNQSPSYVGHAQLDVQGTMVQARARTGTERECIDRLEEQLAQSLRRLRDRVVSRRLEPEVTEAGEWRHGALPTPRPDHYPRPAEEREIVERVTHTRGPATVEEAAFDLDLLEDDFLLYVDDGTGTDAVVRRRDDGLTLGVSAVATDPSPGDDGPYDFVVEPGPPRLTVDEALERLRVGDEPHVFFEDADGGRGAVAYWRYDGHYGIVRPRETGA